MSHAFKAKTRDRDCRSSPLALFLRVAVRRVDVVWAWGDLMNALQVFPNLIGLTGLSGRRHADRESDWPHPTSIQAAMLEGGELTNAVKPQRTHCWFSLLISALSPSSP